MYSSDICYVCNDEYKGRPDNQGRTPSRDKHRRQQAIETANKWSKKINWRSTQYICDINCFSF
jgi:hypothetical protein